MTEIPAIFAALNRARVRDLFVGGYASVVHGVPRTTLDVDLALDPNARNVEQALQVLRGIGLLAVTERVDEILARGGVTARNDRSVDLLTSLPGRPFRDLWTRLTEVRVHGVRIRLVSRRDQIRLLRAAGRPGDLQDAETLEEREE